MVEDSMTALRYLQQGNFSQVLCVMKISLDVALLGDYFSRRV